MENTPAARYQRALDSLEGLSVGDAFGEGFFMSFKWIARMLESGEFGGAPFDFEDEFIRREFVDVRRLEFHTPPWHWTDDTAMALEIVTNLRQFERIEPDALARGFSTRYTKDPLRGYGSAMYSLLPELLSGDWRVEALKLFRGSGSFGNGAAMRIAPVGAYFADDPEVCAQNATLSSQVTHSHHEGVMGGIAVAMAACFAARSCESETEINLIGEVLPFLEASQVKRALNKPAKCKMRQAKK